MEWKVGLHWYICDFLNVFERCCTQFFVEQNKNHIIWIISYWLTVFNHIKNPYTLIYLHPNNKQTTTTKRFYLQKRNEWMKWQSMYDAYSKPFSTKQMNYTRKLYYWSLVDRSFLVIKTRNEEILLLCRFCINGRPNYIKHKTGFE